MASINGISIRNLAQDENTEDFTGIVCYEGKELGEWISQESNDTYMFDEHQLDNIVQEYNNSATGNSGIVTLDSILGELIVMEYAECTFMECNDTASKPVAILCLQIIQPNEKGYEYFDIPKQYLRGKNRRQSLIDKIILDAYMYRYGAETQVKFHALYYSIKDFDIKIK